MQLFDAFKQYLSEDFKLQRKRQDLIEEILYEAVNNNLLLCLNSLPQPDDRTTTDFGITAAVENNFDPIIEIFHDEIYVNEEQ